VARILVTSMPFAGHVTPMAAVAGELARRGHEIVSYVGAKYREAFVVVGADWLPWTAARDYDDARIEASFPQLRSAGGLRRGPAIGRHVLLGTARGQAEDILTAARRQPFDLVVADQLAFGGPLAAEVLGIPFATVCVTHLSSMSKDLPPPGSLQWPATGRLGQVRDAVLRALVASGYRLLLSPGVNRLRASVGLGPTRLLGLDSFLSPRLVLAQGVPGLEYPSDHFPPQLHFVGRLAPPPATDPVLPSWWPDLTAARAAGRPVVHVTQGTLDLVPDDLVKPALAGLAGDDVLIVASTGAAPQTGIGTLPPNARVAPFLPYDQLLPLIDVMVTNGGWGGVLAATQAGVPLVVAAGTLDKPEIARRVAWSGVGLDLHTGRPKPERLRWAVWQALNNPRLRIRSRELGQALTTAGGASAAATLIEQLRDCRPPTNE
jgi:UDP:flavonoid glycosyltransferase YjiC (YdhE family)